MILPFSSYQKPHGPAKRAVAWDQGKTELYSLFCSQLSAANVTESAKLHQQDADRQSSKYRQGTIKKSATKRPIKSYKTHYVKNNQLCFQTTASKIKLSTISSRSEVWQLELSIKKEKYTFAIIMQSIKILCYSS